MSTLLLPAFLLLLAAAVLFAGLALRRLRAGAPSFRTAGLQRLADGSESQDGSRSYFAVVEFDRFGPMRNTIGFEIAASVLAMAGERISGAVDHARLGRTGQCSVEFTFRSDSDAAARQHLSACLDGLEETIEVSGVEFRLKARAAFAPLGPGRAISDALVDSVNTALSRDSTERVRLAQEFARGPSCIADLDILRGLPRAIAENELALHYQPKFDCRAGVVSAAEALLRWDSPELGRVPVDQIIALAERTGAIRDITLWVAKQVGRDQAALQAAGHHLTLFINISGLLIADRRFMLEVLHLVRQAPGTIGIEITETAVIDDPDAAIENIGAFSAAGIPVAIDDFGAGLSSLAYLKRLPADELKIDREFVMGLTGSHRDPLIVRATIDLAHALEMKVTAEGVDDPMSLSLLRVMGCDTLQGYFISRPVPLPKLVRFLDSEKEHLSAATAPRSWSPWRPGVAAG